MIEARVRMNTKDEQLKKVFNTTTSLAKNRTRLAFALFPTSLEGRRKGHHVRQALQTSPVEGKTAVDKVHVRRSPSATWDGDGPSHKGSCYAFLFLNGSRLSGSRRTARRLRSRGPTEKPS